MLFYGETLADDVATAEGRRAVQAELAHALMDGPGIVVFTRRLRPAVVDRATAVITALIEEQKARGVADRRPLRQARQQRPAVERAGEARRRRPRGLRRLLRQRRRQPRLGRLARPELPDRLRPERGQPGRHGADRAPRLPPRLHGPRPRRAVPGARAPPVAGADAAGRGRARATCRSRPGRRCTCRTRRSTSRATWRSALPEFQEYFDAHYVQLPLEKGDAVFFNPALLHGAGTNRTTDVKRMANLLQVSSAFGRAMGTVDTERVRRRSTRRCGPARRPARPRRTCATSSPPPRRATPSRRTWTATSRSAR